MNTVNKRLQSFNLGVRFAGQAKNWQISLSFAIASGDNVTLISLLPLVLRLSLRRCARAAACLRFRSLFILKPYAYEILLSFSLERVAGELLPPRPQNEAVGERADFLCHCHFI